MRQPESKFDNRGDTARPADSKAVSTNNTDAVTPKSDPAQINQIKMINSEADSILYIPKIQSLQTSQTQKQQNNSPVSIKNDMHTASAVQQTVKKKKKKSLLDNILNTVFPIKDTKRRQHDVKNVKADIDSVKTEPAAQLQSKPQLLALPEAKNKPDKTDIANLFLTPKEQAEIYAQSSKKTRKNEHIEHDGHKNQEFQKIEDNIKNQDKQDRKSVV